MLKIFKFISPTFKQETREIIIYKPKNVSNNTPVLFFYDGQILKLGINNFNQQDGINIWQHLNLLNKKFIIIASNSMNNQNEYSKRQQELKNKKFYKIIKKHIILLQKKYKGPWFGFGFSLTGKHILYNNNFFNYSCAISPYLKKDIQIVKHKKINVYFGKKEYKWNSQIKINKPIKKFKKMNPQINVIEYAKLRHTFKSWDQHFLHILKSSVVPYLIFQKNNIKPLGNYINNSSNISFINKKHVLKIKYNNVTLFKDEWNFIQNTFYKNDYQQSGQESFLKKYYHGQIKRKITKNDVINLAKELKKLHNLPINHNIKKYKYNNHLDLLKQVMTHGDLNYKNIIFKQNKCYFIDFEWSRINNCYWDIVSILNSFKLNKQEFQLFLKVYGSKINYKILKEIKNILKNLNKDFKKKFKNYFIVWNKNNKKYM